MGYSKSKQILETEYCYFCQKEIIPGEAVKKLNLYTWVTGVRKRLVGHTVHFGCFTEGDHRRDE